MHFRLPLRRGRLPRRIPSRSGAWNVRLQAAAYIDQEHSARLRREAPFACGLLESGGVSAHALAEAFGAAVDAKDRHTASHSLETAALSEALAAVMGLTAKQVERVHLAAHLHDIGKIGVPEAILGKPGPLTAAEFAIIKTHPEIGARILGPCFASGAWGVLEMVLRHHERFDGSGYPGGLCGRDIPMGARIIAVADSYSAMRQDRPYRKGMAHEAAMEEIATNAGKLYDPEAAKEFLANGELMRSLLPRPDNLRLTDLRIKAA